jgi:hypothetical protein
MTLTVIYVTTGLKKSDDDRRRQAILGGAMARIKGQEYRWVIKARYPEGSALLLLDSPLRYPIFTTSQTAKEFRRATAQMMDKSLPIRLEIVERKWPTRQWNDNYIDNNPLFIDPPISECARAILMIKGRDNVRLVSA